MCGNFRNVCMIYMKSAILVVCIFWIWNALILNLILWVVDYNCSALTMKKNSSFLFSGMRGKRFRKPFVRSQSICIVALTRLNPCRVRGYRNVDLKSIEFIVQVADSKGLRPKMLMFACSLSPGHEILSSWVIFI